MLNNLDAYQAEVRHRRRQILHDLARRQRVKEVKNARRHRDPSTRWIPLF